MCRLLREVRERRDPTGQCPRRLDTRPRKAKHIRIAGCEAQRLIEASNLSSYYLHTTTFDKEPFSFAHLFQSLRL